MLLEEFNYIKYEKEEDGIFNDNPKLTREKVCSFTIRSFRTLVRCRSC